jgi:hypothetical protein
VTKATPTTITTKQKQYRSESAWLESKHSTIPDVFVHP